MVTLFRPPEPLSYDSLQSMVTKWKSWYKEFDTFMTATEQNGKSDETKICMFLNLIGVQGTELYESFKWETTEEKTLASVVKKFEDHMSRNDNVTINRYETQNPLRVARQSLLQSQGRERSQGLED